MPTTDDILRAVRREIDWAKEGPVLPEGETYLTWLALDDWTFFNDLQFNASAYTAALIEDELHLDSSVPKALESNSITRRNPRYVFLRLVDQTSKVRKSIALFRKDVAPSEEAMRSVSYISSKHAQSVRAAAASVSAVSSVSPRSTARDD